MDQDHNRPPLFTEFPPISTTEWKEKIISDLKGADYRHTLFTHTDEGIEIKPFYRKEDLDAVFQETDFGRLRPAHDTPNGWSLCQDIFTGFHPGNLNGRILAAFHGGAEAVRIHLAGHPEIDRPGLEEMLKGVPLDRLMLLFTGAADPLNLYQSLLEAARKQGAGLHSLSGSPGADPLGEMAATGHLSDYHEPLVKLAGKAGDLSPEMRPVTVNGALIQNAGGTLVQEVAFAMAMAVDYLDILTSGKLEPYRALRALQLHLACGPDYFMEIAKLRAARLLWARICESYSVAPEKAKIRIHATSSEWNLTRYDPYVNMLRGTTEAMSAILGGADLISVLPFDYPYHTHTGFSDRIARNTQIILREEAYLGRVADPASGSYYIESLTREITDKAWELFLETESRGGFTNSFETGWIQERVKTSVKSKEERAASGKDHILGTNAYPDFNEVILQHLEQASPAYRQSKKPSPPAGGSGNLTPLLPFRVADMFEMLRLQTEKNPVRPSVLLFKYGHPGWATARAAFSGNFFACAGYQITDPPVFGSVEEGIRFAAEADPQIVVLCSSDEIYSRMAPEVCGKLIGDPHQRKQGKTPLIVVAGNPEDSAEILKKAGVDSFIHRESHLLNTLRHFQKVLLKS